MTEWISVDDRLPEVGDLCLLYKTYPEGSVFHCRADHFKRNFILIGGLRYDNIFVSYENQYSNKGLDYITHWMPLPEPPIDKCRNGHYRKEYFKDLMNIDSWICQICGAIIKKEEE